MSIGTPDRLIASSFGLGGFAVAIVAGMAVGNPSSRILTVAIASMIVCHIIGLIAGAIGERVVSEYMVQYRATRPVSETGVASGDSSPNVGRVNGVS